MHLLNQQHLEGRPCICLGDFNEILVNEEKRGGVDRSQHCMNRFREALEGCNMSDLGYEGDMYTCRNNCTVAEDYICGRLDRAVANMEWCAKFPEFRVRNEFPRHSDHHPMVVDTVDMGERRNGGGGSFRFEARWFREDGCDLVVEEAWRRVREGGEVDVAAALKGVARDLSRWIKEVVGNT